MTDKQIIIDSERMFECVWCKYDFKESDAHFILSENPNECVCSNCMTEWADNLLCDLIRKEQECERLKEDYTLMKQSRDLALKNYDEEFEYKRQITVEHLEQKKELLKQLDQLKVENLSLKRGIEIAKEADKSWISKLKGENEELKKQVDDLIHKPEIQDKILWKIDNKKLLLSKDTWIYKLEETLTEIKEIASREAESSRYNGSSTWKQILQKISEVEDEYNG